MLRTIFHMLLGLLLWAVFVWYWSIVMQRPISDETRRALLIVGITVGAITLFDVFWVFHNIRISRRNRRTTRRPQVRAPSHDFLGRSFIAQSDDSVRRARYVEVHVVEIGETDADRRSHKLFRVSDVIPRT